METKIENKGGLTIIRVSGRLDTVNSGEFEKCIASILQGEMNETNIDCSGLDYISSSGLRLFLMLYKVSVEKKVCITITGMKPEVKSVFDITGFTKLFIFG
jgi:anti-sigma B factor antagonist